MGNIVDHSSRDGLTIGLRSIRRDGFILVTLGLFLAKTGGSTISFTVELMRSFPTTEIYCLSVIVSEPSGL